MKATLPLAIFFETAEPSLRLSWAATEIFGLKPSLSQEGFPQSLLIRSFAKLFRQCAGASASKGVERCVWKEQTTRVVTSKRGSTKESALTLTPSRKRAPRRFSAPRIRFLGQVEQTPKMRSTSNKTSELRRKNLLCPDLAPNQVWAALRRFLN